MVTRLAAIAGPRAQSLLCTGVSSGKAVRDAETLERERDDGGRTSSNTIWIQGRDYPLSKDCGVERPEAR